MKLDRIYIEITNRCNISCTFCPKTVRVPHSMTVADFKKIVLQCAPMTKQVFLHVMGEPLLHSNFAEIIATCKDAGVPVQITTNGTLINNDLLNILKSPIIRQINFSIQCLKDNYPEKSIEDLLLPILDFCKNLQSSRPELYINLRFWNTDATSNDQEIDIIENYYQIKINRRTETGAIKSKKIFDGLYLHFDTRFVWPDLSNEYVTDQGSCYALQSQIAILSNGTVVPCCLDRNGEMSLGNCLEQPLNEILNSEKAQKIRYGFKERKLIEPLCQHCSYSLRYNKKK